MTDLALTPTEMDLTLKKLGLTPQIHWGQGVNDPKFQSLNRALPYQDFNMITFFEHCLKKIACLCD